MISSGKGKNGEQAVIGVGQSIKKSYFSDVRNSLYNINQDNLLTDDLKLSQTMTDLQRKTNTPLPECALASLNEPKSAVALYASFKSGQSSKAEDTESKIEFKNKKFMSKMIRDSSPRADYGAKKQAQIERISQLSQYYGSSIEIKRPTSS